MAKRTVFKNKKQLIASLIKKSDAVLDVGFFGQGLKSSESNSPHQLIKSAAADVYGLDLNLTDEFLVANSGGHYFKYNAENFKFEVKFDVIFAGDLLEHLSNPGLFLDACRQNLIDGGRLVITTPNCFNLFNLAEKLSKYEPTVNKDHACYFNYKTLNQLFLKNNFKIADWGYVYSLDYDCRESLKKKFLNVIYRGLSFFTDKFMETLFIVAQAK